MGERGIQGVNVAEELEELDLLEELQDGDELKPLDDMLQGSQVVPGPTLPPPARSSAPPPPATGRVSAPPPLPPEARRSSAPPGSLPSTRSGIFTIDKDAAARPDLDANNMDPRARALQIDRLRLNVRLRDDRIRELERALQAQSRREQELERRAADETARAEALQLQLGEPPSTHDRSALERDLDDLRRELTQERERAAERERALEQERERSAERERELGQALAAQRERVEALESQLNDLRGRDTADDLKRIPGIGPAFERALARLGVSSFAQIAQWNADDVLRIAGELNVSPRRIDRDGWIARARELCGMTQIGMPAPALDGDSDGS
jgi:predicted flap endonuclease-1-like 5' DNA nuclease